MNNPGKIGCGTIILFFLAWSFIDFSGDLHDARQKGQQAAITKAALKESP